jgi:uncharacterized protein GlcG (DUF336 family)
MSYSATWAMGACVSCVVFACGYTDSIEHHAGESQTQKGNSDVLETTDQRAQKGCDFLPGAEQLETLLKNAPGQGEAGGLFNGRFEWAAVVNRQGEVCAQAVSSDDASATWPGSHAIAKAKAYTANAFSTDAQPLSTARLYTLSQPGHSLWGAGAGNPFNIECLATPSDKQTKRKVCGGTITFGGGVPLYSGQTRVGGLGVSGDTPCADHEIAKRLRTALKLDPVKGPSVDDIQYSSVDGATIYTHPLCPNTWRDGQKIGDEAVASGY